MKRRIDHSITLLVSACLIGCGASDPGRGVDPVPEDMGPGADEAPDGGVHADASGADASAPDARPRDLGPPAPNEDGPFAELYEQGVLRHAGMWQPTETSQGTRDAQVHVFKDEDGPRCYTGEDYFVATRDGEADDLMIFLQGGGFCAPDNCEATTRWMQDIISFGILQPANEQNPTRDFDVGYLPYCDGSFFSGDADHDVDGDGVVDRSFHGLKNLTASIELLAGRYPSPPRILLVGNSAGGFAVHNALPIVRAYYPDVPIEMINDSGVGILPPGGMERLSSYWNSGAFFPESCADCIGEDGRVTGYHSWQLARDPDVRLGYISTRQDDVSSGALGGPAFEAALLVAVEEMKREHGDRFNSLILQGSDHTFVLRDFYREVSDTTVRDWIEDMLSGGDWESVTE